MSAALTRNVIVAAVVGAAMAVSGCVQSRMHLSDDYGQSLRQDVAAQVADPDARYGGLPAPGAQGHRVGLALDRYNRNAVTPPASTSTSSSSTGGGSGGGGGGGSGGSGGPPSQ